MSEQRRKQFPFDEFEPRWQQQWETANTFSVPNPGEPGFDASKPKFYALDMFPYPSGAGLHVGHPEGYTATDIVTRQKRMAGYNVLHPMGWDAFGLPAEEHARKTGEHPQINTENNINNFRRQLKRLGFAYDWQREVNTTDPGYVRWTQWIFLQLYNSYFDAEAQKAKPIAELEEQGLSREQIDARRLAYVAEAPVNWCPELGTVLANEEVEEWRSKGHTVERRPLKQWMLRITAYAERLIAELDGLDWPEGIKMLQRNWIGRSEGAEVDFQIGDSKVTVFTTRPDTLFGATYMVLAPEHPLVDQITTPEQAAAVEDYRKACASKSDLERTELAKEKTGVPTGGTAINPVNGEQIPVWIADYVMMSYGTGAIMAVPAHDERDHQFATQFGLPIVEVVERSEGFQPSPSGRASTSGATFQAIDRDKDVAIRDGRKLPHWTQDGATYAVTFRLDDSLPKSVLDSWKREREDIVKTAEKQGRELSEHEQQRLRHLHSEKVEAYLDAGHGECWLKKPEIAELVAGALKHFDGDRYELHAWCVMPNHVHVVFRAGADEKLEEITHSWKSFTAGKANRILQREGAFWQAESYDHLIRDGEEWRRQTRYVADNPAKAGLGDWAWVWRCELEDSSTGRGQDALATATVACFTGHGTAINSGFLDGLPTEEAKAKISAWLDEKQLGKSTVVYKLRDWLFSRQRYWGEPFPILWKDGQHYAIEDSELPLLAPELEDYKPSGTPEPILSKAKDWVDLGDGVTRETNTMPQWAGSCWYYLRYCDSANSERFISREAEEYWLGGKRSEGFQPSQQKPDSSTGRGQDALATSPGGVDLYIGGTEHAVLHLLYARFWHKVLFDHGHVSTPEPFQKLVNQGLIMGEDGQKMSKSRGNVVNPDDVVDAYGADSLRLYEMFMGPLEQVKPWSMNGVEGVHRFLARVWRLVMEIDQEGVWSMRDHLTAADPDKNTNKVLHRTIKKVSEDIESLSFNTAISQMMVCTNELMKLEALPVSAVVTLLQVLNPFAPHVTEELSSLLAAAHDSVDGSELANRPWPQWDAAHLLEDEIELVIQVNGKKREVISVATDASKEDIEALALARDKVTEHTAGLTIRKVIVVPGRLVNIVAN